MSFSQYNNLNNNKSAKLTLHNAGISLKLAMMIALLMVICVWLGVAGAALLTYQDLQRNAQQRLLTEIQFLQSLSADHTTMAIPTGDRGVHFFFTDKPLPKPLKHRLQTAAIITAATAKDLGWQAHGIRSEVSAMIAPNTQPPLIVAVPVEKGYLQRTFVSIGVLISLAIFTLMLAFIVLLNAKIKRRIRYIDRTAHAIMRGDLQKRVPVNPAFDDEYSRLATTLNAMLDKIAQLMQELRHVNNNVAHDLKSPLNRMRSRMEVALMNSRTPDEYQQALAQSIEDIDALLQTFQSLLLMGNLSSNARDYQLENVSLSTLTENIGELYAAVAEAKSHTFELSVQPDITVFANANLLGQALSNLLDNAIKYTPEGGRIRFSVSQTAATALIVICDNGIGIPAEQREAVFERFTRLDAARQLSGVGLGMSLVRAILAVHHAGIQLHDNQPGLRVEVRLRAQA